MILALGIGACAVCAVTAALSIDRSDAAAIDESAAGSAPAPVAAEAYVAPVTDSAPIARETRALALADTDEVNPERARLLAELEASKRRAAEAAARLRAFEEAQEREERLVEQRTASAVRWVDSLTPEELNERGRVLRGGAAVDDDADTSDDHEALRARIERLESHRESLRARRDEAQRALVRERADELLDMPRDIDYEDPPSVRELIEERRRRDAEERAALDRVRLQVETPPQVELNLERDRERRELFRYQRMRQAENPDAGIRLRDADRPLSNSDREAYREIRSREPSQYDHPSYRTPFRLLSDDHYVPPPRNMSGGQLRSMDRSRLNTRTLDRASRSRNSRLYRNE